MTTLFATVAAATATAVAVATTATTAAAATTTAAAAAASALLERHIVLHVIEATCWHRTQLMNESTNESARRPSECMDGEADGRRVESMRNMFHEMTG